jgi:aldose 1-epimerase
MPDGREVEAITLSNDLGLTARIISYGATLQALTVPDRAGRIEDVTLGYADMDGYLAGSEYFGATVGRVANRIARGRFTLDGREYQVPVNNGDNSLHGGTTGFDRVPWEVVDVRGGASPSVTLRHVSPDGDQGYPGTVTVTAVYSLVEGSNTLSIEYHATTDRPTLVNLSNHAYWNLAGEGVAAGGDGAPADHSRGNFLPTDEGRDPDRGVSPRCRHALRLPRGYHYCRPPSRVRPADLWGKGYDHNWVIDRTPAQEPRLLARLEEPASGRVLEVLSNQPGVQFYSGNFLDGTVIGKAGKLYRQGDAVALEPQMFPDTPNRPEFGSVRLDPGQTYRNIILFRFSVTEPL